MGLEINTVSILPLVSASNLTMKPDRSISARLFLHRSMLEGKNLSFQKHFELI